MKNYSIWLDGVDEFNYPILDHDISVDVLIVGGGITGISTAYHLKDSKLKICLVDRNKIGHGISSKTTGKLTILQDLMYSKLSKKHKCNILKEYLNSQKDAIKLVETIIKKNNINCDYVKQKSYLFASTKEDINKVKHEAELLKYMKVNVKTDKLPLNIENYYSVSVDDSAYFHPLKYISCLGKICHENNVYIYENTKVTKIIKENNSYICYANGYKIIAQKVVLASHYPFFLFPFLFPLKGYLERSFIGASRGFENKYISGINTSKRTKSFRYHDDYFIYLTNSHNLGFHYNIQEDYCSLIKEMNAIGGEPAYIWSNIDIITNDYLPYIGSIKDNLYIGTGYNTWGMTNGSIAGKLLSDLIQGKKNKYESLFNPKRCLFNVGSLLNDMLSSAKPFIENKINKNKVFYSKNVVFTKMNGKNVAIYKDLEGKEHIVYNKCPHLKCSLIFNEVEKTWDCPCHASRFDIDGKVIEGPSNFDISYKEKSSR